jgi:ABC-type multidrug transport system fused ATPase/permease subunit
MALPEVQTNLHQYTTPALYTYESVMAAEFHNVNFTCATGSIVPAGSNYTDVAYQSCAYAGSQIGSTMVNGDDYLAAQFGFYYSHVWRNFGILCLFTVVFIGLTCWLSEVMEWELDSAGPIQYKGSRCIFIRKTEASSDEENTPVPVDPKAPPVGGSIEMPEQTLSATESTFTWSDLELNVQIGKGTRKLLDNVCGYCKPGSLTALVGASGAGKSTCKMMITPLRGTRN